MSMTLAGTPQQSGGLEAEWVTWIGTRTVGAERGASSRARMARPIQLGRVDVADLEREIAETIAACR